MVAVDPAIPQYSGGAVISGISLNDPGAVVEADVGGMNEWQPYSRPRK
jgi:hypothetical protein